MSDASSAEIAATRRDWKDEHLDTYLGSRGAKGHIVDVSDIGGRPFTTTLLLKYIGRKSGRTMITPLIYGDLGGEVVIVASKGGSDQHPAWYLNIHETTEVEFQIATQRFVRRGGSRRARSARRSGRIWRACSRPMPATRRDGSADTHRHAGAGRARAGVQP